MMRKLLSPLVVGVALAALPVIAPAQDFPNRAVKLIVPNPAGGAIDTFARALAARLAQSWGQPVSVENRSGASQIIGSDFVSKAIPDGYTLLVAGADAFVMNPHLYKNLLYDGLKGFTPITGLVNFPWVVVVNASVPANSFQELLKE